MTYEEVLIRLHDATNMLEEIRGAVGATDYFAAKPHKAVDALAAVREILTREENR